jgi:type IV pilus assembly protein PilC
MPTFAYKATDISNHIVTGTISAPNAEEVAKLIEKQSLTPVSIKAEKIKANVAGSLPEVERIAFCRYMGTILNAGLPLTEGVPVLKDETKHPLMRQILDDIVYHLERGQSISLALQNYPKAFNTFFVTLIKAGEVSGTLSESFKYLELQLRAEYSLGEKIKSALMYPMIVFIAMIGISFLMFFFILPQIGKVFLTMSIPLHPATKFLFTVSIEAAKIRIPLIAGIILSMIGLVLFVRQPAGKHLMLKIISPLPVVSTLLQKIDIARFSRIFSTLVASAVPITQALDIALSSLNHPRFRTLKDYIIKDVTEGKSVSSAFSSRHAFPPLLTQMVAAGEKSGELDTSLKDLASFYEEEVEESVKKVTQLIEPLLMLVVGIGVGGIILAIIVPLYSVVGSLSDVR